MYLVRILPFVTLLNSLSAAGVAAASGCSCPRSLAAQSDATFGSGQSDMSPTPRMCQLQVRWAGRSSALEFGQDTGPSQKSISLGPAVPIEFALLEPTVPSPVTTSPLHLAAV